MLRWVDRFKAVTGMEKGAQTLTVVPGPFRSLFVYLSIYFLYIEFTFIYSFISSTRNMKADCSSGVWALTLYMVRKKLAACIHVE